MQRAGERIWSGRSLQMRPDFTDTAAWKRQKKSIRKHKREKRKIVMIQDRSKYLLLRL